MSVTGEKKKRVVEMTTGSLWKNIFLFSIPLMFSQVLEVLFNLSDVAVVGRFADYRALGSVGSTTLLVTLFTGFLIGMGCGVNVKVAHELGAGNWKKAEDTIHTSLLICLCTGIVICLICFAFAGNMLALMNTKDELMDGAVLYMKIYAFGMPAMAVYNFGNGVLSARGETTKPLIYLSIAGVLNVILNLFFVIRCHMAADGVATASVIAQYASAALVIANLLRRKDECHLYPSKIRFHESACKAVLVLGITTGLQNAIFAIANLFIQTAMNSFDAVMVSGNAAAMNADTLIFNIMMAFYTACASFISQNWGAGNKKRMLQSYLISMFYAIVVGATFGILLLTFGRQFLGLFATDEPVIQAGLERIRIMWFSYMIAPFMDCTIAASRGIGKSGVPTVIVILGSCVFRVIWVYTIFAYFHTVPSLYLLYTFSWILTGVAEIIYFTVSFRKIRCGKQMEEK